MDNIDKESCWYQPTCITEMNNFIDNTKGNTEVTKHLIAFVELLKLTDESDCEIIDLGCGTAMLSEYCSGFTYIGADLSHIISGCAMRNYPNLYYRSCDLVTDDLSWISKYRIAIVNGVIDILQNPLEGLDSVLSHASKYVIVHRQEITEEGQTHTITNGSYGGYTYHSVISRKDFISMCEKHSFDIVREEKLHFVNWENNGSSFLLCKRQSWALSNMDFKLNAIFNGRKNGVFLEAGANDGVTQSNSYYFERYHDWRGVLVEPIKELVDKCMINRSPKTIIEQYALVGSDFEGPAVEMLYTPKCRGLMSTVNTGNSIELRYRTGELPISERVPVITLNALLEKHKFEKINLMILDLEGYEPEALKGLDLAKWDVEYLLIEELEVNTKITDIIGEYYELAFLLSEHDYLYKRKV